MSVTVMFAAVTPPLPEISWALKANFPSAVTERGEKDKKSAPSGVPGACRPSRATRLIGPVRSDQMPSSDEATTPPTPVCSFP